MANSIYNKYRNINQGFQRPPQNNGGLGNILAQLRQVQQNPGAILDIMLQNGKISQQEYQDLQPYKDNPQQLVQILSRGHSAEISQAQQQANGLNI